MDASVAMPKASPPPSPSKRVVVRDKLGDAIKVEERHGDATVVSRVPELPVDPSTNALVLAARQLKARINEFLQEPIIDLSPAPNGKQLPYPILLEKLDSAFRRQHEINKTNAQLNVVQYIASVSMLARNRALQRAIREGQLRIAELEMEMSQQCDSIVNLESVVRTVDTAVADQQFKSEQMRTKIAQLEAQLAKNMEDYRAEMGAQKRLLAEQASVIANLTRNQLSYDVFIEAGILVSSGILCNLTVVDYLLGFLASLTFRSGPPRRRIAARQFAKAVLFLILFISLRSRAKIMGLHSGVGSVFSFVGSRFLSFIGFR